MTVAAILREKGDKIVTAKADDTLVRICALLKEHRIGAVVVLDGAGAVTGILSERDIVRALADNGQAALQNTAAAFMTRGVVTCTPGESIETLMEKMTHGRFRHLPVIDHGKLVGIISIGDVVKRRIADVEHDALAMREYIATG